MGNTIAERSQTKRGEKTKREKREQDMRRQIRKLESVKINSFCKITKSYKQ